MPKTYDKFTADTLVKLHDARKVLRETPAQAVAHIRGLLLEIRTYRVAAGSGAEVLELHALHLLCHAYHVTGNGAMAIEAAEELITLSKLYSNREYAALAECIIAKIETIRSQWDAAKQRLTEAVVVLEQEGNYEFLQSALLDLSTIEQCQNNYDASMQLLLRAEMEYQKHPINKRMASVIMANLADVYMRLNYLEKAIEYITISLQEAKESKEIHSYCNSLLRLSNVYARQGNTAKQIATLEESIEVLTANNLQYPIAVQRIALGTAYMDQDDFGRCLDTLQEALAVLSDEKDKKNLAALHERLGMLYSHLRYAERHSETAQYHFLQAERIAIDLSMSHFHAHVLGRRADSYSSFGQYKDAFTLLQQATALEKQIINEKSVQSLRDLEVRYDVALTQKKNELLQANNHALELERNHLQAQLNMNNNLILTQMNELNSFRKEILNITKQLDKAENIVRKVKLKLKESPLMQGTWESYLETFTRVHPDYETTLRTKYPELTAMEIKICILIRAGLHSDEISQILTLSARTIENHRFNLRKKLGVGERENLGKFLMNV
jgi:ATP/maltotriose-dependent transcriptional regulator MalT